MPSALALVRGGTFTPRSPPAGTADEQGQGLGHEGGGAQGQAAASEQSWDTPVSAQHLLLGMQQAHGKQLAQMGLQLASSCALVAAGSSSGGGGMLGDLLIKGLATDSEVRTKPSLCL